MRRDSTTKCGFRSSLEMSVFAMDTDRSAELLVALRECDQRPLITADRMIAIKALELAAVTREQPMFRANRKRKRNLEKA